MSDQAMLAITPRQRYLTRNIALKQGRSSWLSHYRELAEYIQPRRMRYLDSDVNRGDKRNDKLVNNTPLHASRVLAAGMMAGVTSPARKWFKLTAGGGGEETNESGEIREWLDETEEKIFEVYAKSNIYGKLHGCFFDLGVFGTSALYVEEDREDVIRGYGFPVGQYCLQNSDRLQIDTCARELSMSVGQVVQKFGLENCSVALRDMYKRRQLENYVRVLHFIEPNPDCDPRRADSRCMPYRSCWLELAGGDDVKFLRESGYLEFPVMAPRWDVTGEDVYGSGPGMDALGDCKALQVYERESAKAVSKLVTPPMVGPGSMRNQHKSLISGEVTYVDGAAGGQKFEPAMRIEPGTIEHIQAKITAHEKRINTTFHADLFLMLLNDERSGITAEEIRARQTEKMMQLGPVLERLNDELLDPLLARTIGIMGRGGLLPPPPQEMQGRAIKVEYISILGQAQKLLGTTGVERLLSVVGNYSKVFPDITDTIDSDAVVDEYSEMLGVPAGILRTPEQVQQRRQQRAQAQQAAAQGQAMATAAKGAKDLSGAGLENDNALSRLLGNLGPGAAAVGPQAGS